MSVNVYTGDCRIVLQLMPSQSVHCCVTSPPYFGLRDYGIAEQIGLEQTPAAFVAELVAVFAEVRRVLRDDGTLWLNLGDSYANPGHSKGNPGSGRNSHAKAEVENGFNHSKAWVGAKNKDLIGIPWRVAFALQADGWYLRQDIIWHKPNPMPESVTDRCTKAHEYLFLLSKSPTYYCDMAAIAEPSIYAPGTTKEVERAPGYYGGKGTDQGRNDQSFKAIRETRNKRSVWTVPTRGFKGAHFATFPIALIEPCIKAGCPVGGTVLDPFGGAGTTAVVADSLQRDAVLIELNPEYAAMAKNRLKAAA